jgi:hypothetical protein
VQVNLLILESPKSATLYTHVHGTWQECWLISNLYETLPYFDASKMHTKSIICSMISSASNWGIKEFSLHQIVKILVHQFHSYGKTTIVGSITKWGNNIRVRWTSPIRITKITMLYCKFQDDNNLDQLVTTITFISTSLATCNKIFEMSRLVLQLPPWHVRSWM